MNYVDTPFIKLPPHVHVVRKTGQTANDKVVRDPNLLVISVDKPDNHSGRQQWHSLKYSDKNIRDNDGPI